MDEQVYVCSYENGQSVYMTELHKESDEYDGMGFPLSLSPVYVFMLFYTT